MQFGCAPIPQLDETEALVWSLDQDWSAADAGGGRAPEPIRFSWLLEGVLKGTGVRAQDLLDN